jgi:Flp pilus assembly protein TadG
MVAILFPVLIAMAGLVIDGGTKLNDAENAYAYAQEAARAGAGQVNRSAAYSAGTFTVDQAQAIAAARTYLAAADVHGTVAPEGNTSISVTVTITAPTKVLSIIGIDRISATSSASASLVTGITRPTS